MIPISIPISTNLERLHFLHTCLCSLFRTSTQNHEVVLVTETFNAVNDYAINNWNGRNIRVYEQHKRPIESIDLSPEYEEEYGKNYYNPVYQFLNYGINQASNSYIMTPVGDDSYFTPNWESILSYITEEQEIWTPSYVTVRQTGSVEEKLHYSSHPFEYRVYADDNDFVFADGKKKISERVVLTESDTRKSDKIVRELAGERKNVAWPHSIMHKTLFQRVGGYKELPPFPAANDLDFFDELKKLHITVVGVMSSVIVNSKIPIRLMT